MAESLTVYVSVSKKYSLREVMLIFEPDIRQYTDINRDFTVENFTIFDLSN